MDNLDKKALEKLCKHNQSEIAQQAAPFYTPANIEYVKKSVQELRAGKGKAHELLEVGDE